MEPDRLRQDRTRYNTYKILFLFIENDLQTAWFFGQNLLDNFRVPAP